MRFVRLSARALLGLCVLTSATPALAAPGDLDASFGAAGLAELPPLPTADFGLSFGEQADGSIVLLGRSNNRFSLARLTADGALDATFGEGGVANAGPVIDFGFGDVTPQQMAVLPDDRMLALFAVPHPTIDDHATAALVRFTADGALDGSFGDGGVLVIAGVDVAGAAVAYRVGTVASQGDGKVVLLLGAGTQFTRELVLVRLDADGAADLAFGDAGVFRTGLDSRPRSLTVLDDGSILFLASDTGDLDVGKVASDGTWDPVFNSGFNVRRWYAPDNDRLHGRNLAIGTDGSLFVGATLRPCANCSTGRFAVHKLTPDGGLDFTFADQGTALLGGDTWVPDAGMALLADGDRLVFAGGTDVAALGDVAVHAISAADGTAVAGWGTAGRVESDLFGRRDVTWSARLQTPGKVLVFGTATRDGADQDLFVARYTPSGALDPSFGDGGVATVGLLAAERGDVSPLGTAGVRFRVAALPDGAVVGYGDTGTSLFVHRWAADGTPDASFGDGGLAVLDFYEDIGEAPPFDVDDLAPVDVGVALIRQLADGSLLVGGQISYPDDPWIVAKLRPDGRPDASFGRHGRAIVHQMNWSGVFSQSGSGLHTILPMDDGSIILHGQHRNGPDFVWDRVLRLGADGVVDPDYGRTWVKFDWGSTGVIEESVDVIADAGGGRLYGAGYRGSGGTIRLFRLDADASYDPTFGVDGLVEVPLGDTFATVVGLVVEGGTIRVTGTTTDGSEATAFEFRTDLDGALDMGFGDAGVRKTALGDGPSPALEGAVSAGWAVLEGDARSYLAGRLGDRALIARFMPDNTLDPSFGDGSVTTYELAPGLPSRSAPPSWYAPGESVLQAVLSTAAAGDPLQPVTGRRGVARILTGDVGTGAETGGGDVGADVSSDAPGAVDSASSAESTGGCGCTFATTPPPPAGFFGWMLLWLVHVARRRQLCRERPASGLRARRRSRPAGLSCRSSARIGRPEALPVAWRRGGSSPR